MSLLDTDQIKSVLGRLASVETDLSDPNVLGDAKRYRATLRDHAFLKKLESAYSSYEKALADIKGNEELLEDPDFREEAILEIESIKASMPEIERKLMAALIEPDPFEGRNAVLEIRAGTGGYAGGELQGSPVWQALAGHKRSFPLAVVLPPPARGPGTLIPSAQRLVWAAKQPLGNAALGALFA